MRLCLSGAAFCTGLNPCKPCQTLVWSKVLPRAMVAGGFNTSPERATHFFEEYIKAWEEMLAGLPPEASHPIILPAPLPVPRLSVPPRSLLDDMLSVTMEPAPTRLFPDPFVEGLSNTPTLPAPSPATRPVSEAAPEERQGAAVSSSLPKRRRRGVVRYPGDNMRANKQHERETEED